MKTKICYNCGVEKPLSQFPISKRYIDNHLKICFICKREYNNKWRKKKLKKEPIFDMRKDLKTNHSLSIEQYNEMLKSQNRVCAICGKEELIFDDRTKKFRRLAVDHNHKTGKIRGLLCSLCNRGLGFFYDDINLFKKVIKYLRIYK